MPRSSPAVKVMKSADAVICTTANAAYNVLQFFNKLKKPNKTFTPKWSDKPLLKSWEKSQIKLGWPRETESLCPRCISETREKIISGEEDYRILIEEEVGIIKAQIVERDGQIWMEKECPTHGKFTDLLSIDKNFFKWVESHFPGKDICAHNDENLHNHGPSSITHGRGAVLTVDLTNRCNMMCDPCFANANQVGFVHELEWDSIKQILDNALKIKPRRQMSVQFSGGEPTLSPLFFRAIRYSRRVGYNSVQCATNGLAFAKDFNFAKKAAEAGLRFVYFQFDGIGNDANSHRHIGNLFDIKLKAIDNIHKAGTEIVLVTTLINDINNDQVGSIVRFALDNPKKIAFVAFQPVSFTGRDEDISEERRLRQRYTLSHLAYDVKEQTGMTEPLRDWFPLTLMTAFSDLADLAHGAFAEWGQVSCGCHPDCGIGTALMVDKETKEFRPIPEFMNFPRFVSDVRNITDSARNRYFTAGLLFLSLLRNYKPFKSPSRLTLFDLFKKFDKSFGITNKDYGKNFGDEALERRKDPWNFLFIAGMHFQDLFTYDFQRTRMCVIPYGTQEGEISFCAYNTGHGWRNIIENMHSNSSVDSWFQNVGRHDIHAGNRDVILPDYNHSLVLRDEDVHRVRVRSDKPQTSLEEKIMARQKAEETAKNEQEEKLVNLS